jgi:beta-lactam-binding protein with PASTA domain
MSARDAMRKLTRYGLSARMQGDGFVAEQDPAPGTPVDENSVCRLTLARVPARQTPATRTQ